jgi:hypothetical protein
MRWDRLFSDLEARFEEIADSEAVAEMADRQRIAVGAVGLTQRLAGSLGQPIRVRVAGGTTVGGVLSRVGPDWLLLAEGQGRDVLIATRAVASVEGLTAATALPLSAVALKLDLRYAVRGVARDRSPVVVLVAGGSVGGSVSGSTGAAEPGPALSGTEITGTIDRVGTDFAEIAVHAAWEPRRAATVRSVVLVPLAAVLTIRALPLG